MDSESGELKFNLSPSTVEPNLNHLVEMYSDFFKMITFAKCDTIETDGTGGYLRRYRKEKLLFRDIIKKKLLSCIDFIDVNDLNFNNKCSVGGGMSLAQIVQKYL